MRILLAILMSLAVLATVFLLTQPAPPPHLEPLAMTIPAAADKPRYSKSGHDITPLSPQRIDELAARLTPEEARILLRKGTEPPFCGNLIDNKQEGVYICRLCSLPLFASDAKFDSGTGWPSFYKSFDKDHVHYEEDTSHGMVRTEILCARCGGHLGHVFEDGPPPSGLRYCLNSASLTFIQGGQQMPPEAQPVTTATAYFAGGCFWGVEDRFQKLPGVLEAISGYQGGHTENPTYQDVCNDQTGHAETVKVIYDPARITYRQLLQRFFQFHDPSQKNRQGPDVGSQYRSAIFAVDDQQLAEARRFIDEQQKDGPFAGRIVTEVLPVEKAGPFWEAEEYHQDYHQRRGTSCGI